MTNRNFEDIDKLFREGLNPIEDQTNSAEADWSKLKDRLDQNENKKRGVFWLTRLSGVAALILLFFTFRMLLPEERIPIIQQAEVQQKDLKNQSKVSPEAKKTVSKTEPVSKTLLAQNKHFEKQSPKKHIAVQSTEKQTPQKDTIRVEDLSARKATKKQIANAENSNASQPERVKIQEQEKSPAESSLFAANEKPNVPSVPEHESRKLALSFLAAPDYNGVNNLNNASMGNDFGLMVSIKIAKNWSFSTGAVYGKKLYETGFSNYNPIKNIWTEYFPKSVTADCRVLDIPLNISYTVLNRKNTSFSLGSGISSYIMLREDYSFTYVEHDDDTAMAYHVVNENQHWLSVINLQATLEQRLNSKLSVGIQPYMKIPLSNIGFAGVKLQSLGMAVILSYNLNL
ncbi:MAG: hypothetical protein WCI54_17250 [Bacteroidia bacterium]|jgi:hypothetical protein